jgi:orotidine-5'-phosphate decarboxylase
MPDQVFLVPGYGAQGGTADDIRSMLRPGYQTPGQSGVLVTASRSVIYAFKPGDADWQHSVAAAAKQFATEVRQIVTP